MQNLNLTNVALGLLGITIYILLKVQSRDKKVKWSTMTWIDENMLSLIISIIATFSIIIMAKDICDLMGIEAKDSFIELLSFVAGYLNQSLLRNLIKTFTSKGSIEDTTDAETDTPDTSKESITTSTETTISKENTADNNDTTNDAQKK